MLPVAGNGEEALHRLLFGWGYYPAQKTLYEALLHNVSSEIDLLCVSGLGSLYDVLEDYVKAIAYHRQALELAKQLGSVAAEGTALGGLGNAYLSLGEHERAIAHYQQHLFSAGTGGGAGHRGAGCGGHCAGKLGECVSDGGGV